MIKFEIVHSRIIEATEFEKKYVTYVLQVRQNSLIEDANPVNVERRYTHFYDLYNGLKTEFPTAVADVNFPKKVMLGNFDADLIKSRCSGFEELLEAIANDSRLRHCPATLVFLRDVEQEEAKKCINNGEYENAYPLLETSFKLLNKVYTDRDKEVILALCRLVAYSVCGPHANKLALSVERWATLALWRFNGVSDSDLLQLYVPLVKACIHLWEILGRDKAKLENELADLRKRGMKVDNATTLREAIETIEQN